MDLVRLWFLSARPSPLRVVVIGGGMAGATTARFLDAHVNVVLVDVKEYVEVTSSLVAVLGSGKDARRLSENICFKHTDYIRRGRVVVDSVATVTQSHVVLASGEQIPYDYVIFATGAATREALFKSPHLPATIEARSAEIVAQVDRIARSRSVLIIGGGSLGVELAAEIAMRDPECAVHLVHREPRLLPQMPTELSLSAERFFRSRPNCFLHLGQTAQELHWDTAGVPGMRGGQRAFQIGPDVIRVDLVYMCNGTIPVTAPLRAHFADAINPQGYVKVNSYLQIPGHERIFAIGDVNDRPEPKLASTAIAQAEQTVFNIVALSRKERLTPYSPPSTAQLVSFGKVYGTAWLFFLSIAGIFPRGSPLLGFLKSGGEAHVFIIFATFTSLIVRMLAWYF